MRYAYHVTTMKNLQSIMKNGLIPSVGDRSKIIGEMKKQIYMFKNILDMESAIINWIGDLFEDNDELVVLKIDISTYDIIDDPDEFEILCDCIIHPKHISVLSINI